MHTTPKQQPSFKTMSRQMNNSRNTASRKPYCKVCHDAGKPESDYTSHHVRSLPDRQGNTKVTCPTLLNTECRYCYELGHTAKFCPVIADRKKTEDRTQREEERRNREIQQKAVVVKPKTPTNAYAALYESDDETAPTPAVKAAVKEEWPTLGEPSKRVEMGGYAAAAAKPLPISTAIEKQAIPAGFVVLKKGATYEKTEAPKPAYNPGRWTDMDSEDEDDENW